jgi:AraC-like DNA-binding protein
MTLNNWPNHIQKYLFLLKDGFLELPYLSNSPQAMLDSLVKLPVTHHKILQQSIYLNNAFCKGIMRYREIEDGFWLLATDININENIIAKAVYDENQLRNYYFLSFSAFEYKYPFKNSSDITLLSTCWTFYKPGTEVDTYFYKGTKGTFFNLAISKEWADKNILCKDFSKKTAVEDFFNTKNGFYTWLDIAPKAHGLAKKISIILANESKDSFTTVDLKKQCIKLIATFFDNSFEDDRILDNVSLNNVDYTAVAKAEKMILHHLHLPFIGIESIAKDVSTSPTKLKSDFKTVFGFSMLQYHKEKNMLLALQLIQNSDIPIRDIAAVTGHECGSKFASNFKKRFAKLPTEMRFFSEGKEAV